MFCSKCGTQLDNSAKFCASCGNPIETPFINTSPPPIKRQEQWSSQWNSPVQPKTKPKVKKSIPKWIFPVVALCVAVFVCLGILINSFVIQKEAERAALDYIDENYCSTFADEVDSIQKDGKNRFTVSYDVDQDYDLWKSNGTIKLSVYKDSDEWTVNVIEDNVEYLFENNDNWYYITASGNREFLIKMIAFNDSEVTLEYYGYDMGSYGGPDDYDHETTTCNLKYDGENRCFAFTFMGEWRINGSYIGYNRFEVGAHYEYYQSSSGGFNTLKPANPNDYWWYEKAKRQTGDYDSASASDITQAKVGDVVSIGKYEMDNNNSNGKDDISWLVIDENESGILVISKYCIAQQRTSSSYETWETSVAREWLNGEFYNNAFTSDEKSKILTSTVVNKDNANTGVDGGNDTSDKLFLLSIDEANKYFSSNEERITYGTLYLQELIREDDELDWWLRTPGKRNYKSIYQSYVSSGGYVNSDGTSVNVYNFGIRPAMWISK